MRKTYFGTERRKPQIFLALLLFALVGWLVVFSTSCGDPVTREVALERVQRYISENFDGLTVVDFDEGSMQKEDGLWKISLQCESDGAGGNRSKRVTLRLFVNEATGDVWGSALDVWSGPIS